MDPNWLNSSIDQLQGLFDEIGIPNHERDEREAEVSSASLDFFISIFYFVFLCFSEPGSPANLYSYSMFCLVP